MTKVFPVSLLNIAVIVSKLVLPNFVMFYPIRSLVG